MPAAGVLTCEAGVTLEQIIDDFAPRGLVPDDHPGTKFVTVGGCIANDVHGKAHHAQGSFSTCVEAMTVLLASGEVVHGQPRRERRSVLGDVRRDGPPGRRADRAAPPAQDRDHLLPPEGDPGRRPRGDAGRARGARPLVLLLGGDARRDWRRARGSAAACSRWASTRRAPSCRPSFAADPLRVSGPPKVTVPFELPELTLNPLTIRAGQRRHPSTSCAARPPFGHYEGFFYPLDMLAPLEPRLRPARLHPVPVRDPVRRRPAAHARDPRRRSCRRASCRSSTCSSASARRAAACCRSPARATPSPSTSRSARTPSRSCAGSTRWCSTPAGGSTSARTRTSTRRPSARCTRRIERWLAIKAKYDPAGLFTSDLARRVGLVPAA